jgi:hypothetical protein
VARLAQPAIIASTPAHNAAAADAIRATARRRWRRSTGCSLRPPTNALFIYVLSLPMHETRACFINAPPAVPADTRPVAVLNRTPDLPGDRDCCYHY